MSRKVLINKRFIPRIFGIFLLFALTFGYSFAFAQEQNAPSIQKNAPVKIQSDNMRYFGKDKKSIFSGNVVAVSDNFTLTSDNVTVFLTDDMDVDKILCKGSVNFKTDDIVAISRDAEVDQKSEIATLTGGVKVWQGENVLTGDKVTMYYKENRIVVNSGKSERVTITFKPGDNDTGKGLNLGPKSNKP